MTFGRLSKLRYLDLKGNPLQPALQRIVGPCLTSKDCMDAAKRIVPFMNDLEVEFRAEQKKKEEEEEKRKEEEVELLREQIRLAKKAARKERVMRERQEKTEAEKITQQKPEPVRTETKNVAKHVEAPKKKLSQKSESTSSNFLSFLKTFISVIFLLVFTSALFLKFLPDQSEKMLALLPTQQQSFIRFAFEKIDGSIFTVFKKVLNLYKM